MSTAGSNLGEPLDRVAKVIRSKNAGPFEITFDIMFDDSMRYERVKRSGVIDKARIAAAYRIPLEHVLICKPFDAALAFKITIRRPVSSGDWMDTDVYGCQQHVPLTGLVVPAA
ncbi:MAG TPA: DUF4387 domain-containing protein [Pseudolabrys sp.]|nr:DUF4387 domain-containing protein [Pseudolabrys sp.]